jgi:ABC-type molybdenum transport system ATPase subunit/photorepair protein PhrA
MWKIISDEENRSKEEISQKIKDLLEGLNGKIPGIVKLEVGINTLKADNVFDVVLIGDFESKEAYEAYSKHEEHAKVVPFFQKLKLERSIVDYTCQIILL